MRQKLRKWLVWGAIGLAGAIAFGGLALHRGEQISSLWFIVAAICSQLIGYRFYSLWLSSKVLGADASRATPAERLEDGQDYVPTNRWMVMGHHFAAIAGPGPLIGPTLAAQFGYLPGTLWILIGCVLGGCVQDMIILFCSIRRDGRGLAQMIRDEIGPIGGTAAMLGTFAIMIILISVLGLVVVKALAHSPWGSFTVGMTIPIAMLIGIYLRYLRPGRVAEATVIGLGLFLAAVVGGQWINENPMLHDWFNRDGLTLAWIIIGYGFAAAVLPVWLLLAPRDYLSTFLKLGTIIGLALAILVLHPVVKMPAFTQFLDGSGPIFGGAVFPFVFITIACGAVSGFHALIASGTTPKMLASEGDIRMVGYGSMLLESFVALMAMLAACILDPGIFFAINSPASAVGAEIVQATATISSWGFPVTAAQMEQLAHTMGETTLMARAGGAPSLAVGMASIFSSAFGEGMLAVWYHFIIMFEAIFILTTLDAGTRVGRFMLQEMLGTFCKPLGRTSWYPAVLASSAGVVALWGYFLYVGVIDPNGGVNILWPLFGMSNQMLAGIALCAGTLMLINSGRGRYAMVTLLPLAWILLVTSTAVIEKVMSPDPRIGFFAGAHQWADKMQAPGATAEQIAFAGQMQFNQNLVGYLAALFLILLWTVVLDSARQLWRIRQGKRPQRNLEVAYVPSRMVQP